METDNSRPSTKVVIVGGVAGGASCAARLRRLDENAEIIMVEKGPYVSYANCGLPYHVGGVIEKVDDPAYATALGTLIWGLRQGAQEYVVKPPVEAELIANPIISVAAVPAGSSDTYRPVPENYAEIERAYWSDTGIFPIMHVIMMRREIYEANRWIAQSLTKAFYAAQQMAYDDLAETAALKSMLPWLVAHVEEARREMGADWWPYGLEPNRKALETFTRYHFEQGLSKRQLGLDELFAPESLEASKI